MGRSGPRHPLAQRAPRESLGRYAQRGPTFAAAPPRPEPLKMPPAGEHTWLMLRWNVVSPGQAAQLVGKRGRVEPKPETLIAAQVACYWCREPYEKAAATRCTAFDEPPEEPAPEEPLEPAPDEAVPVDPPTPPDAEPPVVEATEAVLSDRQTAVSMAP